MSARPGSRPTVAAERVVLSRTHDERASTCSRARPRSAQSRSSRACPTGQRPRAGQARGDGDDELPAPTEMSSAFRSTTPRRELSRLLVNTEEVLMLAGLQGRLLPLNSDPFAHGAPFLCPRSQKSFRPATVAALFDETPQTRVKP